MQAMIETEQTDVERAEFNDLLRNLQAVDHALVPLLRYDAVQQAQEHGKRALFERLKEWKLDGQKITLSWSLSSLAEAYVRIYRRKLLEQKEQIEQQLFDMLHLPYQRQNLADLYEGKEAQ